jgi:UDP-glucose 4-epimerase
MKSSNGLFRDRSLLITGASGFIGRHLLAALGPCPGTVTVLQRRKMPTSLPIRQYACDVADGDALRDAFRECRPDIVIHLAGYKDRSTGLGGFSEAIRANITGTLNIFTESVREGGPGSVIVLGTAEEYGRNPCPFRETMREAPVTPYSYSKTCISHLAMLFHDLYRLPVTVLRPTLAYGPGQEDDLFLPSLVRSLHADRPFAMTPGKQTRDFLYIDDLIDAILRVPEHPAARGTIINIGSGTPMQVLDVARRVAALMGKEDLLRPGQIPYRENEVMEYYVDIRKAGKVLGWKPEIPLETGLKQTVAHFCDVLGE